MAFVKANGQYLGVEPFSPYRIASKNSGGLWETVTITKDPNTPWFTIKATEAGRFICLNQFTKLLESRDNSDGWGGEWIISSDGKTAVCDTVTLQVEGYLVTKPIHLEQHGNDFVDAAGNRIAYPGIDGFDDLWFATQNRDTELNALMTESRQVGFQVRRIWCMGDAGQNQVFNLYPQDTPNYFDIIRQLVVYENSFGQIPLFTAFVDAQKVMPSQGQRQAFWRNLNDALKGSGAYLMSGGNQRSKNGFDPWADLADPGGGVIWSRGSDVDDVEVGPRGAPASELHATRNSFDRALMDATASPPTMRGPAGNKDGHPVGGSGMVWMTEGNPFGDGGGYTEQQAWQLGRGYSILWALAIYHNRQSQRGQMMTDDTARRGAAWVKGMGL